MTPALPSSLPRSLSAAALALPLVLLAGCAGAGASANAPIGGPSPSARVASPAPAEVPGAAPRLVVTYDGGIQVLDATTLAPVADIPHAGFIRVSPAGDGRHVVVSSAGEFRMLDAGTWSEGHGDHAHHFTAAPTLTQVALPAQTPGHAVAHGGRIAFFDDGTGEVRVVDAADVAGKARTHTTPSAHHGVAVELSDGTLVVSEGTKDARTGIRVLGADGEQVASSDDCPGVHGEAVAADEAVLIGCEDGVLVYRDGAITKVNSPDAYGRIGNQAGTDASTIVLGDYKSDPHAELERPTRVSLTDTRTGELTLVDLPASYTFRSLARGAEGEALVLGTDGNLHVLVPEAGTIVRSIPVIDAWEEPAEWQEPRPALVVLEGVAYVTDPMTKEIHAVDVAQGAVMRTAQLTVAPSEIAGASGGLAAEVVGRGGARHDDHHGDGHDH